jgi:hypothetical protein
MNYPKTKNIKKNIDLNQSMKNLLKEYQHAGQKGNHTHTSMFNPKGSFQFNRTGFQKLFNLLPTTTEPCGISETPTGYTMLRTDIDNKEETDSTKAYPLYIDKDVFKLVFELQEYIKATVINVKPEHLHCAILKKDPYLKVENGKTYNKHGFHLQFINLFLNKEDSKRLATFFNEKDKSYDVCTYYAAWLMYGCQKSETSGKYTVSSIVLEDMKTVEPREYFKNYKIYDIDEKLIKYTKPIEFYYPRIFSILLMNRAESNLIKPVKQVKEKVQFANDNVLEENLEEVTDIIETFIKEETFDALEIDTTSSGPFVNLKLKMGHEYSCPVNPSYTHRGRGGYVFSKDQKLFFGCYRDECRNESNRKCVEIGKLENEDEEEKEDENDLDLDCFSAKYIYNQGKGKYKILNGFTYGEVAQKNRSYATWLVEQSVYPHAKYLAPILGMKYVRKSINLDDIQEDETIDTKNIGSYIERLERADIVCLRSNMMTHKTQNLKELCGIYNRIAYVTFRCSLGEEIDNEFKDYGFTYYSDVEGKLTQDRVIVQIDSLPRCRGKYDLIVFDEAVYIFSHLLSFPPNKKEIYIALKQQIVNAGKIIVCDALLNNQVINFFKTFDKSITTVQNNHCSFTGKTAIIHEVPSSNTEEILQYIENQISIYGKVYVPSNSKTFADKLNDYLITKNIQTLLISSETELVNSAKWIEYDCVIVTPTICAGISCNDRFGKTIAYFSNLSSNAQMSTQQLFRVRNTECNEIDIFISEKYIENVPVSTKDIENVIQNKLSAERILGLDINYIDDIIEKDAYYNLYVEHVRTNNLSKIAYAQVLQGILIAHGIKVVDAEDVDKVIPELEEDVKEEMKEQGRKTKLDKELQEMRDIIDSRLIEHTEYIKINEKQRKQREDRILLRKYNLNEAYGDKLEKLEFTNKLTHEFDKLEAFLKYEKKIGTYNNLCLSKVDRPELLDTWIRNRLALIASDQTQIDRIHDKKKYLKIWIANRIVKEIGFDSIWDTKSLPDLPYDKIVELFSKYNSVIEAIFDKCDKKDWSKVDLGDTNVLVSINKHFNKKLTSVLGISVKNTSKSKGIRSTKSFKIVGLSDWDNIGIPPNPWMESCKEEEMPVGHPWLNLCKDPEELNKFIKNSIGKIAVVI